MMRNYERTFFHHKFITMKWTKFLFLVASVSTFLIFTACGNSNNTTDGNTNDGNTKDSTTTVTTLYEKLGGETMVDDPANAGQKIEQGHLNLRSVVDSSIFVLAADPQMAPFFATLLSEVGDGDLSNLNILSKNLTDFFCAASGAKNISYSGMDMAAAHDPAKNQRMGAKADDAAYDQFIADVVIGAKKNNVPEDLIAEVGALIETLRSSIVQ